MHEKTFKEWIDRLTQAFETQEVNLSQPGDRWKHWLYQYIAEEEDIYNFIIESYFEEKRAQEQYEQDRDK